MIRIHQPVIIDFGGSDDGADANNKKKLVDELATFSYHLCPNFAIQCLVS